MFEVAEFVYTPIDISDILLAVDFANSCKVRRQHVP